MNFRIELLLNSNDVVEIKQTMQDNQKLINQVNDLRNLSCKLVLELNDSNWEVEDELPVLVSNFCLNSIVELKKYGSYEYEYFELAGGIQLELMGSEVEISGDFVEHIVVDFEVLKNCFRKIGEVSIKFLRTLNLAKYSPDIEMISKALSKISLAES